MSDDLDQIPERAAVEKMTEAKRRLAVRRLRERWAREGYNPRAHLGGIVCEGDRNVLVYMANSEYGVRNMGAYLAAHDIYELVSAAHRA